MSCESVCLLPQEQPAFHALGEPGGESVTLRMVLAHTSGLSDDVGNRNVIACPGERWSYSTCGYFYLQHVADSISGTDFGENLKASILEPFGMQQSFFTTDEVDERQLVQGHRKNGSHAGNRRITHPHADGLLTTSSDYAQFVIEATMSPNRTTDHLLEATELEMLSGQVRLGDSLHWGRRISSAGEQPGFGR